MTKLAKISRWSASLLLLVLLLTPVMALAQGNTENILGPLRETANRAGLETTGTGLPELIGNIIKLLLSFLGILAVLLILYAGFLWMTDQGDADQVKKAKSIIINSIIGIVIILSAYIITEYVISELSARLAG